ncbi:MAG: DNA/RNA non-specific endonuclease [Phycisphaerae bacterium]
MARRRTREPGPRSNAALLQLAIVLLLILVVAAGLYFWKEQQKQGSQPRPLPQATTAASTTQGLISDDGILFAGMPEPRDPSLSVEVLKNRAYMVGYSEKRKDPLWSAYRVRHMEHPYVLERPKGEFLTDDRTFARVSHHDFTGSGFDRGHMTPNNAIAHCYGGEAQKETFLLSNICPQAPALNQKVWEHLEARELAYADDFGEIWVIDGPIFPDELGGTTRTLRSGIAIPAAFYKIILEAHSGRPRLFAVIMPQTVKGTESPQQFLVSLKEVEEETGLTFFPRLEPATHAELESRVFPMW